MYYVYADGESIYNPLDETLGIVSPKVSLELGKAGSFQFDLPPSNTYYNRLSQLKTIITVYLDDAEIFRGRVFSIERKFNKMKTVYCEGVLAYLVDSVQKAKTYKGKAHAFFRKIISGHNTMMGTVSAEKKFTVGDIEIEDADVIIPGKKDDDDKYYGSKYAQAIIESIVDEWLTTFDYINDVLIDYLGGYLVARYSNGKNIIDYISADSLDKSIIQAASSGVGYKEIEFGTNLIDLTEEINAEELFTVLIPLGDDNLTVKSVNKNSIEIVDEAAVAKYGRIVKTHVFDNVNSASTLLSDGKKYLKAHKNIPISFTVRALDMHFIDESNQIIEIGEVVKVKSNPHDISRMLICTKIEYDLQNPANNTYTFGNPKQTMTERYKKNKDKEKKESKKHASSGGGAGAGAAKDDAVEEAVEEAGDQAEEKLSKFYDAWINVDPESGHIDLGTLYKLTEKAFSRTGIELNSSEEGSSVNIFTMHDLLDEHNNKIGAAETNITSISNALKAEIDLETAYRKNNDEAISGLQLTASDHEAKFNLQATVNTKLNNSIASVSGKADANGSSIQILSEFKDTVNKAFEGRGSIKTWVDSTSANVKSSADWITSNSTSLATITSLTNAQRSVITSLAKYETTDKKDILSRIAKIESSASKSESRISLMATFGKNDASFTLKADSTGGYATITALNTEVKNLSAKIITADAVITKLLSADRTFTGKLISKEGVQAGANSYVSGGGLNIGSGAGTSLISGDLKLTGTVYIGANTTLEAYIKSIVGNTVTATYINNLFKEANFKAQSMTVKGSDTAFHAVQSWNYIKEHSSHSHDNGLGNHVHTYYQDINGVKKQFNTGNKNLSGSTGKSKIA